MTIIIYSQMYHPAEYKVPRYFYDPNTLFNEHSFTLEGDKEYIIIIKGLNYEHCDNNIYQATIHVPNGPLVVENAEDPQCICLLIRHVGPEVNLTVAPRTSLAFLLENARVSMRLAYISNIVQFCLRHDEAAMVKDAMSAPRTNHLTTYSPYLRSIPSFPHQSASRHPLLMRRLLDLPKLRTSPLANVVAADEENEENEEADEVIANE